MALGDQILCWYVVGELIHPTTTEWPVRLSDVRSMTSKFGVGVLYYQQHASWLSFEAGPDTTNGWRCSKMSLSEIPKPVLLLALLEV
jgi:hypothetical protein